MMSTAWAGQNSNQRGWAGTGVYGNGGWGGNSGGGAGGTGAGGPEGWQHYPPPVPQQYTQPSVRYA